ncbi:hypothetical protein [Veronia pacifica]|uniref:Uncharacterized protein n=1 Tax=Veronia pacifica TaxID=1080227 RepID=A0A1C3EIN6_9GAMM|nr:hypothetical protein [Veronia pacifica]ODA33095.1 hypothetical protein A8L45_11695 [Veronia pacifica]
MQKIELSSLDNVTFDGFDFTFINEHGIPIDVPNGLFLIATGQLEIHFNGLPAPLFKLLDNSGISSEILIQSLSVIPPFKSSLLERYEDDLVQRRKTLDEQLAVIEQNQAEMRSDRCQNIAICEQFIAESKRQIAKLNREIEQLEQKTEDETKDIEISTQLIIESLALFQSDFSYDPERAEKRLSENL